MELLTTHKISAVYYISPHVFIVIHFHGNLDLSRLSRACNSRYQYTVGPMKLRLNHIFIYLITKRKLSMLRCLRNAIALIVLYTYTITSPCICCHDGLDRINILSQLPYSLRCTVLLSGNISGSSCSSPHHPYVL